MENIIDQTKAEDENVFIDDPALIAAKEFFHIKYLFPWQRLVIANIMDAAASLEKKSNIADCEEKDGNEALRKQIVLLPTGAGKSLCFLIPSLLLNGPTLVMYPLLALMSDQKRRMDEGGISNVVFRGEQSEEEREENFLQIEKGVKIILANPEVLQNEKLVERLSKCKIIHAAIDEAHCVSEWGDTFRPAYLTLGKILKKLNIPLVTAFTATASPSVLKRVAEILFNGEAHLVRSESDRANIHYNVIYSYAKEKEILYLAQTEQRPMIIFCGTRNHAEKTARNLRQYFEAIQSRTNDSYNSPENVRFYHAGLSREEKAEVEQWFYPQENAILCATCAFGMGVDKKNIRTVIHRDVPSTIESFIQESGRGARDGGIAQSFLLWNYADYQKFSSFPHDSRERVMLKFAESKTCRRQVLLDALDAEQAACMGCDICKELQKQRVLKKNKNHTKEKIFLPPDHTNAQDRNIVLKYIRHFSKSWDKEQALDFLQNKLNELTLSAFGFRVWETSDIAEIIQQLLDEQKIFICKWPWKNKIASIKHTKKITQRNLLFQKNQRKNLCPLPRHLLMPERQLFYFLKHEPSEAFFDNAEHKLQNSNIK